VALTENDFLELYNNSYNGKLSVAL
jgi:hypothetical protein